MYVYTICYGHLWVVSPRKKNVQTVFQLASKMHDPWCSKFHVFFCHLLVIYICICVCVSCLVWPHPDNTPPAQKKKVLLKRFTPFRPKVATWHNKQHVQMGLRLRAIHADVITVCRAPNYQAVLLAMASVPSKNEAKWAQLVRGNTSCLRSRSFAWRNRLPLFQGKMGGKQKASQQRNRIHTEQRSFTSFHGKRPFEALRCREAGRVFGQWNPASSKTRPIGGSLRPQWTNWTRVVGCFGHIHWTSKFLGTTWKSWRKKTVFSVLHHEMYRQHGLLYLWLHWLTWSSTFIRWHSLCIYVYWLITFITLITFTTLPSQQITLISVVLLTTFIIYIRYLSCHSN